MLADDRVWPIAHKGGAGVWPENTMAAFAGAVALGCEHLELDLRATADGKLVVFHDPDLSPVTSSSGRVGELSAAEVLAAKVAGVEPVCLLDEVLASWPDVRLWLDPKADAAARPLIGALGRRGLLDRVCVGAFSDRRLGWFRDEFGDAVCLSMGPLEIARLRLEASLPWRRTGQFRSQVASLPPRHSGVPLLTRRLIDYAHSLGVATVAWTIDEPAEMRELCERGVDGIITDRPHVLLDVLGDHAAS